MLLDRLLPEIRNEYAYGPVDKSLHDARRNHAGREIMPSDYYPSLSESHSRKPSFYKEPSKQKQETMPWYAIKTHQDFRASQELPPLTEDLLFPTREVILDSGKKRIRPVIPRVLFIKTTEENALQLEHNGRLHPELSVPFWIYRYPTDSRIREIREESIRLLRLLTSEDTTRCEIFTKKDFKEGQQVRVTGGPFKGYEGTVTRIKRDRHVIVKIEGICMIMLPFIHPDLLEKIE